MKRAYRTIWKGHETICAAETPGHARAITVRIFRAANYKGDFTQVNVRRAPQFDAWAEVDESGYGWDVRDLTRQHGDWQ
jgi:hypothetical protein